MKHMHEDINEQIKISIVSIYEAVNQEAENCAEIYVSSTLGLSDSEDSKQTIKNQYIDLFMEEIRKQI